VRVVPDARHVVEVKGRTEGLDVNEEDKDHRCHCTKRSDYVPHHHIPLSRGIISHIHGIVFKLPSYSLDIQREKTAR
jgi:hypothetical protein